jgi:hypothetical protein
MQYVIYCNKITEAFVEFHKHDGESMSKCIARLMREQAEEFYKGQAFLEAD